MHIRVQGGHAVGHYQSNALDITCRLFFPVAFIACIVVYLVLFTFVF
jgi:hypothetical protein